jgi:hypothetical protein
MTNPADKIISNLTRAAVQHIDKAQATFNALAQPCEIESAILAEREACAAIADEYENGLERNYSALIADKIRARGGKND